MIMRFCYLTSVLIAVLFVGCVSTASAGTHDGEFICAKTEPDPLISELFCTHVVTVKNTGTDYTPFELEIYRSSNRLEKEEFSLSAGDTLTLLLGGVMGDPGPRTYTYKLYWDRTWPKQDILLDTLAEERRCYSLEEVSYTDNEMIEVYIYAAYAQDEIDFANFIRADTAEAESLLQQAMIALKEGKHGEAKYYVSQSKNSAGKAGNTRLILYGFIILPIMLIVIGLKLHNTAQRNRNEVRSIIEKWQECPICGSKESLDVGSGQFSIVCRACSARWLVFLGFRGNIKGIILNKPDSDKRAVKYLNKIHAPEWWLDRAKLLKSDSFEYIKLFAKRYIEENKIHFWNINNNRLATPDDIDKLKKLLAKNGFEYTEADDIKSLITEEIRKQTYEKFKSSVLSKKPKSMEKYIECFIEYFEINDNDSFINMCIGYLEELLVDEKIITKFEKDKLLSDVKQVLSENELKKFEKELKRRTKKVLQVTLEELDKMEGYEFERFLSVLYENLGYKVAQTKLSKDQGADLVIVKDGERIVVQAKRYSNKVGNKAIREIAAAIKHYGADRGIVVTTNVFTQSAIELAKSNDIELVDRNKLKMLIENAQKIL